MTYGPLSDMTTLEQGIPFWKRQDERTPEQQLSYRECQRVLCFSNLPDETCQWMSRMIYDRHETGKTTLILFEQSLKELSGP